MGGYDYHDDDDNEIRSEVEAAIAAVPGAIGVSNHGIESDGGFRVMQLYSGLWDAGLIFWTVGRRPTMRYEIASDMGLAALRNRIFIDGDDVTVVGTVAHGGADGAKGRFCSRHRTCTPRDG